MKILFQGDSITDAGRDRSDPHDLGRGYPLYTAELIRSEFPETEFEFIDLGISGNRSENLLARMESDIVELQPDLISILIGVNDVWHRQPPTSIPTTDEQFEANYRRILEAVKMRTNAKLLMIEPYLLDLPIRNKMRPELIRIIEIVRMLAREYADAYLPLDGLLAAAEIGQKKPKVFSDDGIHPNAVGARWIAERYLEAAAPLIRSISNR